MFVDQIGLTFDIVGAEDNCNLQPDTVPKGATAVVLNVTVVRPTGAGYGTSCECVLEELPVPRLHSTDVLIDVMGYYMGSGPKVVPE